MQSFREWLQCQESSPTTRALSEPWAYPALAVGGSPFADTNSPQTARNYKKMVKRDSKKRHPSRKKKVARPNNALDGFVREMELLKKDLAALSAKKTHDRATQTKSPDDKPQKPVKQQVDEDLMKAAKVVLTNLKGSPNYYARRDHIDRLAGLDRQPIMKKLSRQDVKHVAKELGVDFASVRFTPEAFRKAIESELSHSSAPQGALGGTTPVPGDEDGPPMGVVNVPGGRP